MAGKYSGLVTKGRGLPPKATDVVEETVRLEEIDEHPSNNNVRDEVGHVTCSLREFLKGHS